MRRYRGALAAACAVLAVGVAGWFAPFLLERRDALASAASPAPPGRPQVLVELPASGQLCLEPTVVNTRSDEARFGVRPRGSTAGPPLRFSLDTPAGSQSVDVAGGYTGATEIRVPLAAPRAEAFAEACIENLGDEAVGVRGTGISEDLSDPRPTLTRDGRTLRQNVTLSFYERARSSLLSRVPVTLERMSLFRPAIVGWWLVWPLAFLVVLGVPASTLWALARAFGDDLAARPRGTLGDSPDRSDE